MTDIMEFRDLGFESVLSIDAADPYPRAGLATFRGVQYRFRSATVAPRAPARGRWYELAPVDSSQGLPIVADGEFRRRPAVDEGQHLEVRWTSVGSPGLSTNPRIRGLLATFLEGLAAETATDAHWDAFIIEHYEDPLVEQIRGDCAAMLGGDNHDTDLDSAKRAQLFEWASQLRVSNRR